MYDPHFKYNEFMDKGQYFTVKNCHTVKGNSRNLEQHFF